MKKIFTIQGLFLILVGVIGFLSNPEKAQSALFSGALFGGLYIVYGFLSPTKKKLAFILGTATSHLLNLVFIWRAYMSWYAYSQGNPEKIVASILISSMLASTLMLTIYLAKNKERLKGEAT